MAAPARSGPVGRAQARPSAVRSGHRPGRGRRVPGLASAGLPIRRLGAMTLVICVVFVAVVARLVMIQQVHGAGYAAYGVSERTRALSITAERGSIVDRSGNVLAMSVALTTIYADPHQVTDPRLEASELAPVLQLPQSQLQAELSTASGFEYLAHAVPDAEAAAVEKLNLPGIATEPESKRFDPDGTLAASVLGGVDYAGVGSSGVEYQYNARLAGKPGLQRLQEGLGGQAIPGTSQAIIPAVPGQSLELTLDSAIQYETESVLGQEIVSSHAIGGTAVIMQSKTGQILAMADLVADAKSPTGVGPAPSDTAVTRVYEPGSVMKGVTMSAALQTGVVVPSTRFVVPYSVSLDGSVIHDAEVHPVEYWSIPDILAYSSNVGTLHVSQLLGTSRLYQYMRAFGLGSKTALDAPGESQGILPPPSNWSGTSIGTIPIGQGVAVTSMQMLDVYNTIANGGRYVAPSLVKGWVNQAGVLSPNPAPPGHRVVTAQTARQMTAMLVGVVKSGTGTEAAINGYDVAGKTGTAQKPNPTSAGYLPGQFMGSFVGFAPAEDPQLTAIVVLDRPTPVFYGGSVAAPVFSQIMAYAMRSLQIPPPAHRDLGWDVPVVDASAAAAGSDNGPAPTALPVTPPPPSVRPRAGSTRP
ncbi:MAG TPA: penicillin-binding protein 2 [Acidimicrobiales bacterium]|nr:penicillin-binding protein 2 [Acidimicrobiales bacterium]